MGNGGTRILRVVLVGNDSSLRGTLGSTTDGTMKASKAMGAFGFIGARAIPQIAAALAAANIGKKIYDVGSSFEKNVNKIIALAKPGETNVRKLSAGIQKLGPTAAKMGLNVSDASAGMLELVKAGIDVNSALKALPGTMALATAGEMELGESASFVSDMLNAFQLPAKGASDAANKIANAANISSADVSDLRMALGQASSSAANAGLSFTEVNAALAVLANVGIKGSDAGTSLKTMLMRLQAPMGKARATLDELGVSVFNSDGKMRDFSAILGDLQTSTADLTDAQRAQALTTIFGSDAIRAANSLIGVGAKGWDKYKAGVDKAGGAQKLAQANTAGLSGALAQAGATLENIGVKIYRLAAPAIEVLVRGFTSLISQSGKAGGFLTQVADWVIAAWNGVTNWFNTYLAPTLIGIWASIKPHILNFVNWVRNTLIPFLVKLWQDAKPILDQLGNVFRTALQAIKAFLKWILPLIEKFWKQHGKSILAFIRRTWNAVLDVVSGVLKSIEGVFNVFAGIFTGDWRRVWKGIKQIFSGVWKAIKAIFRWAWDTIKDIFWAIVNAILGKIRSWSSQIRGLWYRFLVALVVKLRSAWQRMVDTVKKNAGRIIDYVRRLPERIVNALKSLGRWLYSVGRDAIQGLINGIKSMASRVASEARAVVAGAIAAARAALAIGSPSKVFFQLGAWTSEGMALGIEKNAGLVESALATMPVMNAGGVELGSPAFGPRYGATALAVTSTAAPSLTVNVHVHGNVTAERDLAREITKQVRDGIVRIGKRNGGVLL